MKRQWTGWTVLSAALMVLLLGVGAQASRADEEGDDGEGEEIPFEEASVFFELNDTDGDLGIHALVDGEPWKELVLEAPDGRKLLGILVVKKLGRQGLTELFFESAEPTFDEFPPEKFFRRFPEGEYEFEGITLEGDEMESVAIVTHLMPAPADNLAVNGVVLPEDCDAELPTLSEPYTVSWDAVTTSHPEIGRTGEPIEVVLYQLVLEREEPTVLNVSIDLPPDVTELTLPAGLTNAGEEIKVEVLVREASGNQTAVESCFEVE